MISFILLFCDFFKIEILYRLFDFSKKELSDTEDRWEIFLSHQQYFNYHRPGYEILVLKQLDQSGVYSSQTA
ncbi:hypothetical protein CMI47_18380 [Candidatus Pacearchaeota archaeon]|nr:hypothetical protein [Candidatus Pacearchaeota archaeon]